MDLQRFKREFSHHFDDISLPKTFTENVREVPGEADFLPGPTTRFIGHLLNFSVSLLSPAEAHLQLGTYCGRTLAYAMSENLQHWHYHIANFHNDYTLRKSFLDWMERNRLLPYLKVIEGEYPDVLTLSPPALKHPVGVFFYSAESDYEKTLMSLRLVEPLLANQALVILDNANSPGVSKAGYDWVLENPHTYLLYNLPTFYAGHTGWWNGIQVICYRRGSIVNRVRRVVRGMRE